MPNEVDNSLIESGIPMPDNKHRGRPRRTHYSLLPQLEIGQSVFVPGKSLKTVRTYLSSRLVKPMRDEGKKFYALDGERDGEAGVRIWRRE